MTKLVVLVSALAALVGCNKAPPKAASLGGLDSGTPVAGAAEKPAAGTSGGAGGLGAVLVLDGSTGSEDAALPAADAGGLDAGDAAVAHAGTTAAGVGGGAGNTADCVKQWYHDADGDKFGAQGSASINQCSQPTVGWVANDDDCDDTQAIVKPGQPMYFVEDRGDGSFDYDCDGEGVPLWQHVGTCPSGGAPGTSGWLTEVPACGQPGDWKSSTLCSGGAPAGVTQKCH